MNVQDLIDALSKYPPEAEIQLYDPFEGEFYPMTELVERRTESRGAGSVSVAAAIESNGNGVKIQAVLVLG